MTGFLCLCPSSSHLLNAVLQRRAFSDGVGSCPLQCVEGDGAVFLRLQLWQPLRGGAEDEEGLHGRVRQREELRLKGLWLLLRVCHTVVVLSPDASPRVDDLRLLRSVWSLQQVGFLFPYFFCSFAFPVEEGERGGWGEREKQGKQW